MPETPADRWLRIEQVYGEALDRDAAEREAYLDDACAGDADLRAEVASLLRFGAATGGFLNRPALLDAASGLAREDDDPPPQIAGYEVKSLLGMGGMGLVYRARDVRLDREAALKVLARSIANEPAYRHRFEEEARAASGLNHPNIVTIYGVGEADGLRSSRWSSCRGARCGPCWGAAL